MARKILAVITLLLCTSIVLVLTLWLTSPIPLVSEDAVIPEGQSIKVWRWGNRSEVEEVDVDVLLANELLAYLRQYSALPRPLRNNTSPRRMSNIPFELEIFCIDHGPKYFVFGNDYFWYRSAGKVEHVIQDGGKLTDEIASLLGIER